MTSRISSLKIGPRLILGFAIIILLMLVGISLLAWQFRLVNQESDRVSALAQELVVVSRFQTDLLSLHAKLDSLAKSEDVEGLKREARHTRSILVTDIEAIRDALVHLPSDVRGDTAILPTVEAVETTLSPQLDAVIALAAASDWNAVRLRLVDEKQRLEARASDLVRNVQQQVSDELVQSVAQSERVKSRILLILPVTAFLTLLLATLLGTAITRSITVPLRQLLEGSTALARGDFDYQVQLRGKDELAHVGTVFNQTSAKLGELYRKLEEAQRITHVGYWEWDLASNRVTWSDETYRIYGLQPQERPMDVTAIREMVHHEDREFVFRAAEEALRSGMRPDVEHRIVRPSGEVRIVHSQGDVKRDASGRPYQMFGTVQDITDRKRAEETMELLSRDLQESKTRLEEAQRIAHVGHWVWDLGKDGLTWSDETYRIFGLRPQERPMNVEAFQEMIHPEDREFLLRATQEARGGGGPDIEFRIVRPSGEVRIVHSQGAVTREVSGQPRQRFGTVQDITDRKRAEEALRRSEKELRHVIDTIPAIVWSALPDGSNAYVNRRFIEYSGLSAEQTAGSGWQAAIHPDDLERHAGKWMEAVATGKPHENEVRFRRSDGQYRWHLDRGVPLRDEDGNIVKWYGVVTDIEDRKRAEEELRRSQFYLSEGQRLARMGSWAFNPSGFFDYWSEELFQIYGLDPQKGAPTLEQYLATVHPQDRDFMAETIREMHAQQIGCDVKKRIVCPDGGLRYIRCVGIPVVEGEVLKGFLGTAMDITEQELLTQELERRQAYLAEAQRLTHTSSWVWRVDDRSAVHLSEEWHRIYGFDPAEGAPVWEKRLQRVHPEDRPKWAGAIEHAILEKTDYDLEFRILLPEGTVKWIHTVGHPVLTAAGDLVQFVGSSTDITERKRTEEERERLHQLEADLAHINRVNMMGEMAASLAHEIKQPIAAAITSANTCIRWLAHEPPNIVRARAAAGRVEKDGSRAAEIIDRIRSLYRKAPVQRELVDVNGIIYEMLTLLQGEATRHGIELHTELAAELPKIMADRVQLQQVFMNLLLNAIDAMQGSGGDLTVKSQLEQDGQLLFSVSDAGVGLPAENLDQIFSAFFTTKPHGSGMGLAISRSIVESHGGRMWAAANGGPGATFHFTLPTELAATSPLAS